MEDRVREGQAGQGSSGKGAALVLGRWDTGPRSFPGRTRPLTVGPQIQDSSRPWLQEDVGEATRRAQNLQRSD